MGFSANGVHVAKKRGGRPKLVVTEEQRDRARELFGKCPVRSRVVTELCREFTFGRDHGYAAVTAAIEQFKSELASKGEVDALTLGYASLCAVLAADDAKHRDKVAAVAALCRLLGTKALASMLDAGNVDEYLAAVLARRQARLAEPQPAALPAATTEPTT